MIPKPLAAAGRLAQRVSRKPGGTGVVIAAITIPLILVWHVAAPFIVLAALVAYPFLDTPRTLAGRSWWRAALVALPVWVVVFAVLTGLVETVQPLGESAMVYLAPFMLYPFALAIAGLVRLAYWFDLRPQAAAPRTGAIVIAVICGVVLLGPITLELIYGLREHITGNTPPNTSYTNDGEVVSAGPGRVDVRFGDGKVEAVQYGKDTKFDFRGPAWRTVEGKPGATWLKPGQRLNVEYVYRKHQAIASGIYIWVDRKGCAGDEQWLAAGKADAAAGDTPGLAGTTWEGTMAVTGGPEPVETRTFELLPGQQATYRERGGQPQTGAHWRQHGAELLIELNDCYAKYAGTVTGDLIEGEFSNEVGARTPWTAHRK